MGSHVSGQLVAVVEAFPTGVTAVGSAAAVGAQVSQQVTFLTEALTTGETLERLLTCVRPHVDG